MKSKQGRPEGYPLDHIALLVSDIEAALARLVDIAPPPEPVEEFPGEGTREVYLGSPEHATRLLLMQPLGDTGPYASALARRGPGLHHLALRVPDLDRFCAEVVGWLALPRALPALAKSRTLWLARPGIETLLEINEGEPCAGPPVVTRVEVPAPARLAGLLTHPLAGVVRAVDGVARIRLPGGDLTVAELVG